MSEATWGDVVRVVVDQDDRGVLGSIGSVCGIRATCEGRLLLIEFGDGAAYEFWEHHVAKEDPGSVG